MASKKSKFFILLLIGISCIVISFISEIQFHFVQGFMPSMTDPTIFWKAESVEAFNSTSFMVIGVILIVIAFLFKK